MTPFIKKRSLIKFILGWTSGFLLFAAIVSIPAFVGAENFAPAENQVWSEDKRFLDNGDGTITDTQTSLMWMKQDAYQHTGHWLNWMEAFKYVEELNAQGFAKYRDWYIPTKKELQTLFDANKNNGSQVGREMKIHMDPIFAKDGSGSHWAVETNGRRNAFGVVFNHGESFSAFKKSRSRKSVRAVRPAGPKSP